ncbi:MAG: hypothetical protein F4187_04770 [Gemmatimonadetes bacterium]|nr:hypothetical protein [Gemmatimonadota bacterium]
MKSFEDLPLGPETVASLAAEGIEVPTPFQAAAIPVIARGNDLLGRAGPGSGTLVAYGAPLLDRLECGAGSPVCLVICTGSRQATDLARSFARLCEASGARAAALAPSWNLPERADFLFVPADRFSALYDGTVGVANVGAVVLHDGDGVLRGETDRLETFLRELPRECQRIFCGLPFGPDLRTLARRFTRHAVTIPPGGRAGRRDGGSTDGRPGPQHSLNFVVVEGDRAEAVLELAVSLLEDPGSVRHVLLHAASADQAADLGDFLAMHGYHSGPPGDVTVPVWLSSGEDEAARTALDSMDDASSVATVSCSVPGGAPSATLRHLGAGPAWVLIAVRELGHLREVAAGAGLRLKRVRPGRPPRVSASLDELADRLHAVLSGPETTPYYLLVESLLDRFTAAEVAAGSLLLLDRDAAAKKAPPKEGVPEPWSRLFVSAGQQDDIGPRELLGAITSESGIAGNRVGRIDVRERHSLVEVRESAAGKVIAALNGTTLGGRALRVDYDRPRDRRRGKGPKGPPRKPGRRPS